MAVIETPAAHDYWEHRGQYLLMTAFLLAPAAWGTNELVGYALVKPVCANGHKILLTGVALGTFAMAVAGVWIGWSCFAQLRGASDKGGRRIDRSYFLALVAIGFNALIGLLILTAAISPLLMNPCE
jgi:hypothetical protein